MDLQAAGSKLVAFRHGPEEPPRGEVILVHGFQEHADRYVEVAEALAAERLGVTRFDLRGHGRSPGRRGDVEYFDRFLEDLDGVWRAVTGPGPRFLLGHSLGGLIALRWAQTRSEPLAGLVISAPWMATALEVGFAKRLARVAMERFAPGLAIPQPLAPDLLTRDPERQAAHRADRLKHERVTARLVREVETAQAAALAGSLSVSSLFVIPEADPIADSAVSLAFIEGLPGPVDLMRLPDGLHEPYQDLDREAVIRETCRWILERCG